MRVNSEGTLKLLELAREKNARFLEASTSEVYGDPEIHPQTEDYVGHVNPIGPRSCYDESKRFAEALTMTFHHKYNVDTRIVRIFNTYGRGMRPNDGRVIPNFITRALKGEDLTVYGDGSQTRSYCYSTDLVNAIHNVMMERTILLLIVAIQTNIPLRKQQNLLLKFLEAVQKFLIFLFQKMILKDEDQTLINYKKFQIINQLLLSKKVLSLQLISSKIHFNYENSHYLRYFDKKKSLY